MNFPRPYARAFVLQLGPDTDVRAGRIEGRIEHVGSTRSARFRSLDELLTALAVLLDAEGSGYPDRVPNPDCPK